MTAVDLLTTLENKGVRLWEEGGNLRYSSPKGVMTQDLLKELAACKKEMLKILRPAEGFEASCHPEEVHVPFPLTDLQAAYLIGRGAGFDLGNIACHVYLEFEKPDLDPDRLNRNWNYLIRRHGMLRAIMQPDGTQRILEKTPGYAIRVEQISSSDLDENEARLAAIRDTMSHQVFKADTWPLYELRVSMLPDGNHRLHFSMDQLVADGYSLEVLFRELTLLEQGKEAELPELSLSFRDYVLAEQQFENTPDYKAARNYWFDRLDDLPPSPALPLAKAPETVEVPRFTCRSLTIEKEGWSRLKTRAAKAGVTPTAAVLAAYSLVLGRWSKSSSFTLNMTAFNRLPLHPEVMDIVGEFTAVNLLPVDVARAETFDQFARHIQQTLWETMDNRACNGIRVLRELARRRGQTGEASMPVVFTSTIGVGVSGQDSFDLGKFGKVVYHISQTPQVWLDNQIVEVDGALICNWDALDELFPAKMLDSMFSALGNLLRMLADDEVAWETPVRLALPPVAEQELPRADVALPDVTLDGLFRESRKAYPDSPAVIATDRTLTYEELGRYADCVSALLFQRVDRNTPIAIVMHKGWEQAAAALGIMQAGAAYLPVSPDVPRDRMHMLLRDSGISMVLTCAELAADIEWPDDCSFFCIDRLNAETFNGRIPDAASRAEDLAYIIHTSGSTGRPKGVAITHEAAVNTILSINKRFSVTSDDRIFGLSALNFDLSVYDLFGAFAAGAAVVVPQGDDIRDTSGWISAMAKGAVTIWNSVPALVQMLLETALPEEEPDPVQRLRLIMMSGDWIPTELPEAITARAPHALQVSLGGATEAAIWSVYYPIEAVDPSWKSIPYGQALDNQSLHVLNSRMEPCPTWVPGELFIGGAGLAQEYWNDAERTAEAFIVHPVTGKRLYRTGDWARLLPSGDLEFLGREDSQVKIRGYRIELGEIETVLRSHPDVSDCVVTVARQAGGGDQLAAHVVASGEQQAPECPSSRIDWRAILNAGRETASHMPHGTADIPGFLRFCDTLDRLSLAHMCRTLHAFGTFAEQETLTLNTVMERSRVLPVHGKLLRRWLMALSHEGLLRDNGDGSFTAEEALPLEPVEPLWRELRETSKGMGETSILIRFMERSYDNLISLFRGENDPQKILFPDGDMDVAESVYQTNPMSAYYHAILRDMVRAASRRATADAPLRILEVGAGVGSSSSAVLPVLPPLCSRYHFTDISAFFLKAAREKFAEYSFITYGLFDINTAPDTQGYDPYGYDIIIANNVLHNAGHVGNTLTNLRSLLDDGGCLFILDQTSDYLPLMTTLEFLIDFGEYEDERKERQTPFLSRDQWLASLNSAGFGHHRAFPAPGHPCCAVGQHCLIGQSTVPVQGMRPQALLRYLAGILPAYMVPTRIRFIDSIPLTPTGKVDRKQLSAQAGAPSAPAAKEHVAPVTDEEKAFVRLWEELLNVTGVGVTDNFFELGGDSLQLTKLLSRMRELFEEGADWDSVSFRSLFEAPTVRGMLESLHRCGIAELQKAEDAYIPTDDIGQLVPLRAQGKETPLFLACDARNTTYIYRNIVGYLPEERPLYALRIPSQADPEALGIEGIARAHIGQMRTVQPRGPYLLGGFCMGGIVAYEMAQQLVAAGEEVALVALVSSTRSHFLINDETLICFMLCTELEIPLSELGLHIRLDVLTEVSEALHAWYDAGASAGDWKERLSMDRHGAFLAPYNRLAALSQRERLALIHNVARAVKHPFLENLSLDDFEDMFRLYKAGVAAVSRYRPQPYASPILVMRPRHLNPVIAQLVDSAELWGSVGQKFMDVTGVDGGHESCLEVPHAEGLVRLLEAKMVDATKGIGKQTRRS